MKHIDIVKPLPNTAWGLHFYWKNNLIAKQISWYGKKIEVK